MDVLNLNSMSALLLSKIHDICFVYEIKNLKELESKIL